MVAAALFPCEIDLSASLVSEYFGDVGCGLKGTLIMLDKLTEVLSGIARRLSGKTRISEKNIRDAVEEIKVALLEADVNLRVVRRLVNRTIEEALGDQVIRSINPGEQFIKLVHDKIATLLGDGAADLSLRGSDTVTVILLVGLQGSGKTTTAAKLALRLKSQNRRVMLATTDQTRPAAAGQLALLAASAGVSVFPAEVGKPEKIAKNALRAAGRQQLDVLIVDTAGRMEMNDELMREIRCIKESVKPEEILLVADAMTGQSAVEIARNFDEVLNLTGIILSKFDSDTRGGAALSFKSVIGKPVKFIGVGEKLEELEPLYPDRIASRILGMGDIVGLVEKVQKAIDTEAAEHLREKISKSAFTLENYLEQFSRIREMGSMKSMLEMMPNMGGCIDESKLDEGKWKREEAIILSMTLEERRNHLIIGPTRRKRIANGSGTSVTDISRLLKNFDKSKKMMRKIAKNKSLQRNLMGGLASFKP